MKKVVVVVRGGVVQDVQVPSGVLVEVMDYDIDQGGEHLKKDKNGDLHHSFIWEGPDSCEDE